MKILVVEPFYTESHQKWLDGLVEHSSHDITTLTLSGFHWKWRMHGAAVTLAQKFISLQLVPDLILCTDMLDVNVFLGIIRHHIHKVPIAMYFHENQISYPWSPNDQDVKLGRDRHYGFINYTSALSCDHIFFNSQYHLDSFTNALSTYLSEFPDFQNMETVDMIRKKSEVLYLGLDLAKFDPYINDIQPKNEAPIVLWNHRWEFDKNPLLFFESLITLKEEGVSFQLIVLGRSYPQQPPIFEKAKEILSDEIIHWGYVADFSTYAHLLAQADLLPVTSHQDFFGISVVEAIYCNNTPILPRRLAYTEHINTDQFFYEDDHSFCDKLRYFLREYPNLATIDKQKVNSYDWSHQILVYDAAFSRLSANFAAK